MGVITFMKLDIICAFVASTDNLKILPKVSNMFLMSVGLIGQFLIWMCGPSDSVSICSNGIRLIMILPVFERERNPGRSDLPVAIFSQKCENG